MINLLPPKKNAEHMNHKSMVRMKKKLYKLYRLIYSNYDRELFVCDAFEMNKRYLDNLMNKKKMTIKDWKILNDFNHMAYRNN